MTARCRQSQLRGARLFFTKAQDGGAGCFGCHSGPMLNKQPNDPDVAGIGQFVEENFANVGIGDHPVQALNAAARNHATAYHAEDTGRAEITGKASDNFKFRSLTLRQLRTRGPSSTTARLAACAMSLATSTPASRRTSPPAHRRRWTRALPTARHQQPAGSWTPASRRSTISPTS